MTYNSWILLKFKRPGTEFSIYDHHHNVRFGHCGCVKINNDHHLCVRVCVRVTVGLSGGELWIAAPHTVSSCYWPAISPVAALPPGSATIGSEQLAMIMGNALPVNIVQRLLLLPQIGRDVMSFRCPSFAAGDSTRAADAEDPGRSRLNIRLWYWIARFTSSIDWSGDHASREEISAVGLRWSYWSTGGGYLFIYACLQNFRSPRENSMWLPARWSAKPFY